MTPSNTFSNTFHPKKKCPKILAIIGACAAFLAGGCDLFSTQEFLSKPENINSFKGLFQERGEIRYGITEFLVTAKDSLLSRKTAVFSKVKDTLLSDQAYSRISMRILLESTGQSIGEGTFYLQVAEKGVLLAYPESGSGEGARFFPLKTASSSQGESRSFQSLPQFLFNGREWQQPMGAFEVKRSIIQIDTLVFKGRLEETWKVSESIRHQNHTLATSLYWYGSSGLIRGEQTWGELDWRLDNGENPGKAGFKRIFTLL